MRLPGANALRSILDLSGESELEDSTRREVCLVSPLFIHSDPQVIDPGASISGRGKCSRSCGGFDPDFSIIS